jgi:hypothetical protein
MSVELLGVILAVGIAISYLFRQKTRASGQLVYIENYQFPQKVQRRLQEEYPQLSDKDVKMVLHALRDYFYMCNVANKKMVSMPSQVVDLAWHEFILFTQKYESFCKKAIGRFLHHTPAEAMKTPTLAQEGIKRAWKLACEKENIDPKYPSRLPRIFAIDALLNIENGFTYSLDCKNSNTGFCAGDIGCSSGCGGDSGSSSFGDSFGDTSGCGGGCGGD